MKKTAFISFIIIAALMLVSCSTGSNDRSVLWYQEGLSKVSASLCVSDEVYKIELCFNDGSTSLTVIEPENISGITVAQEGSASHLISGDMQIPLSPDVFSGISPVMGSFSLSKDFVSNISSSEGGGNTFTVNQNEGVYTVFCGSDGSPFKISYTGERVFELCDIVLTKPE